MGVLYQEIMMKENSQKSIIMQLTVMIKYFNYRNPKWFLTHKNKDPPPPHTYVFKHTVYNLYTHDKIIIFRKSDLWPTFLLSL